MATHSTHITRQQLVESIVLCGKQIEKVEILQISKPFPKYLHPLSDSWCVIALQKLQQNAVLLDGALEKLDSTGAVDISVDSVAIATPKEFQNLELLEEASTPKIEFEVSNNLKRAIVNGRLDMMVFLLELPIQTATGDSLSFLKWLEGLGETFNWVFHCAIKNGQVEMVDWLLLNTSFNPSHSSINALTYAIEHNKVKVVDRLLKDSRVDPRTPINGYFTMGDGRPVGSYIDAPIIVAVRAGTLDIVNRLLQDERVDPSFSNNLPIRIASCYNNLALVDRLLQDARVDPSVNHNEALHAARARRHTAIVDRLMMDRRVMLANIVG